MSFFYKNKEEYFNFENTGPVGILDSGIGGLTVLKAISKCMSDKNIIYFGDTKRVPYGQRSKDEVIRYASQAINFLRSKGAEIILIACGTATSYISDIKSIFNEKFPILGVIEPASRGAVRTTKNNNVGVICTPVSAKVGLYAKTISSIKSDCNVYTLGCSVLAPLIEKGITDKNHGEIDKAVKSCMGYFRKNDVDTIILGCTHYPIIKYVIEKYAGKDVALIEPGEELATFLKNKFIKSTGKTGESSKKNIKFFVSGDTQKFKLDIENILDIDYCPVVGQVDIENY